MKTQKMKKHNKRKVNSKKNNKNVVFKKNNQIIKPFIKRGDVINNMVFFEKDGLSNSQLRFVEGCEKTLTEQLNNEFKNIDSDKLFSICMYSSKDDFFGGLSELKEGMNREDYFKEFLESFYSKHKPDVIPLERTSQILMSGLNPFQHKKNNEYFELVWNSLSDGGTSVNMNGPNLIKDEINNGWRLVG